jgi:GTP diphosphokinase / guanosine-3',5'-bis(diphosphate) 3'-diphosphatase
MPRDTGAVPETTVEELSRAHAEWYGQEDPGGPPATSPGGLEAAISLLCRRLEELDKRADRGPGAYGDADRALARETLERHVLLADRMGLLVLRKHLEDASFRILDPLIYRELALKLAPLQAEDEMCLVVLQAGIQRLLDEHGIAGTVHGRTKGLYSLYLKMSRLNCPLTSIMDRIGLRVIVPSVADCYKVLALLHTRLRLIPGTSDDYIAHPKANGYRSLHASFYPLPDLSYKPIEVQIRTGQMHHEARFGRAAHWRYKSEEDPRPGGEARLRWLGSLLEEREPEPAPDRVAFIQRLYRHLLGDRPATFGDRPATWGGDGWAEPLLVPVTVDDV